MTAANAKEAQADARQTEARHLLPVYGQLPFTPVRGEGCEVITADGRRILDLYGGHAVAALGYGHPALTAAVQRQAAELLFQSNAVALAVRARAAELLALIAPPGLDRVFLVNSGAEANENALRMAFVATRRQRVLAIEHGFHGRTAGAGAVTWNAAKWYAFPRAPFEVGFIPRDDAAAARELIDDTVAAVIFEPVQGVAGAYDLDPAFLHALRDATLAHGALL
ncbi:MAG TPA: aminotransferase class III-fold pyridoxal phosphate-dependent enzyme, partial [Woeseiaceae bacterium]|nr:aminotransferase class III-fold pyridoxal phosphate-dependent enzyme [Woeseiaceae bacterium]